MEDAAEPAFVQHLLQQDDCWYPAVVVPDHVRNVGGVHSLGHSSGLSSGAAERLFAEHHLACLGGGDSDLRVGVVGARDVNQVDVAAAATRVRQSVSMD